MDFETILEQIRQEREALDRLNKERQYRQMILDGHVGLAQLHFPDRRDAILGIATPEHPESVPVAVQSNRPLPMNEGVLQALRESARTPLTSDAMWETIKRWGVTSDSDRPANSVDSTARNLAKVHPQIRKAGVRTWVWIDDHGAASADDDEDGVQDVDDIEERPPPSLGDPDLFRPVRSHWETDTSDDDERGTTQLTPF